MKTQKAHRLCTLVSCVALLRLCIECMWALWCTRRIIHFATSILTAVLDASSVRWGPTFAFCHM